ncbi:MAG: aldo/keto reductase, partial [Acidimicrobiia bacterium]|nr:aldo/keto reductase [Acidimicrobiia bacterium]
TKAGLVRTGPNEWHEVGRPAYLRQCIEMSLRRLKMETVPLYQLHRIDTEVPREDQFSVLKDMQDEGKVRHVGLSEVGVEEIEAAREIVPVVSVQNKYSLGDRQHEDVLDYCEREGLGFIPWFPLDAGDLTEEGGPVDEAADQLGATQAQVALAWLLRRSPTILLIPGTSSVGHLEENVGAAELELADDLYEHMTEASAPEAV